MTTQQLNQYKTRVRLARSAWLASDPKNQDEVNETFKAYQIALNNYNSVMQGLTQVKIWIETTLNGVKRYIITYARVNKLENGLYSVVTIDKQYMSHSDKFNPEDNAFYTV